MESLSHLVFFLSYTQHLQNRKNRKPRKSALKFSIGISALELSAHICPTCHYVRPCISLNTSNWPLKLCRHILEYIYGWFMGKFFFRFFGPYKAGPCLKGRLNTDTSPQNFWTNFLANDLTEKFKKSAVASALAIPLPLCFSCFVPLRRSRENLTKPFYFYLSRTCESPAGTPLVISLALKCLTRMKILVLEVIWYPNEWSRNLLEIYRITWFVPADER